MTIQEIIRIEKLVSPWDTNSQTSAINSEVEIQAVRVSKKLFDQLLSTNKYYTSDYDFSPFDAN
ncbi:MAG: hypothetical protein OIF50_16750 [Flavobacteriaceae bacterium]|nr:hypothetical protein [Flavobacteriaceae bacterium]